MKLIVLLALAVLLSAEPAHAGPMAGAVMGWLASSLGISSAVLGFVVNTVASVGLSLLSQALAKKKGGGPSGVKIEGTTVGEDTPQKFIIGRYVTGGHLEYHGSSDSPSGGGPNVRYTRVFSLTDVPGVSLRRVMLSDGWSDIDWATETPVGYPLTKYRKNGADYAWIRFHDGTQTTADQFLVDTFGADPDQPWTADHVGHGIAYAVVTLWRDTAQFNGTPACKFELDGIPLYDPRKDSTVGGVGAHRADDPSTWEGSDNLAVMVYNIKRGIPLPDGNIYGGEVEAEDIPLANAIAGMNVCDELIEGRRQFRGGLEIDVTEEPAAYIEELLKAGLGQISEMGGVFRTRWGAPETPVLAFTDGDISISDGQTFDPFPGYEETFNAVRITHPSPDHLWEPLQTPPRYNPVWEAEDGGRRLSVQMDVPACFDHDQAQQLEVAYAADHRRWRNHTFTLPPDAFDLKALDTVEWTSARNGYQSRVFEVVGISYRPFSIFCDVQLRERDLSDYDPGAMPLLPAPPPAVTTVQPVRVVGPTEWTFVASVMVDGSGVARRPTVQILIGADLVSDARSVDWEVREFVNDTLVAAGGYSPDLGSVVISQGVLPVTQYKARIKLEVDGEAEWSDWKTVVTPDVRIGGPDLDDTVQGQLADAAQVRVDHDALAQQVTQDLVDVWNAADAIGQELDQAVVDLTNNISTATAAVEENLTAEIDLAEAMDLPSDFEQDGKFWTSTMTGAPGDHPLAGEWTFHDSAEEGRIARVDVSGAPRYDWMMTSGVMVPKPGRKYRITARARRTGSANSATAHMSLFFRALDTAYTYLGVHGTAHHLVTTDWAEYTTELTFTDAIPGLYLRPGIYRRDDLTTSGVGAFEVSSIKVEDITEANRLAGEIQDIRALNLDGSTALGVLLQQLNVEAGGQSAWVQIMQQAMAGNGNASAAYMFRAVAGQSEGAVRLYAWDDLTGQGAAVYLDAPYVFAPGTVSAGLLSVGNPGNLLHNADFSQGLSGYHKTGDGGGVTSQSEIRLRQPSEITYTGATYPTLELRQLGTATDGYAALITRNPRDLSWRAQEVEPGRWYEFSAQIAGLRCEYAIMIGWRDADGVWVAGSTIRAKAPVQAGDNSNPDTWVREWGKAQAPAGAVFAHVQIQKFGTTSGTSSYVFIHKPQWAETHEHATEPTAWGPGRTTLITGTGIATGAITAEHIDTLSFSVAGLALFGGTLKSDNFNGTIDGNGNFTSIGTTGWAITVQGNIVMNNLVARGWIQDGAVSDGGSFWRYNTQTNDANEVLATITLGSAPTADALFQISVSAEIKRRGYTTVQTGTDKDNNPVYNTTYSNTALQFQERKKIGGSWQGWTTIWSSPWDSDDLFSQYQFFDARLYYDCEDVQWRLVCLLSSTGYATLNQPNVRRVGLAVRAVRK